MRIKSNDRTVLPNDFRNQEYYCFLGDMGYISSENQIRVTTPFKGAGLPMNQENFNSMLRPVRIRIENFFRRAKYCFKVFDNASQKQWY